MLKFTNFKWCLAMLFSLAFANVFSQSNNCNPISAIYQRASSVELCAGGIVEYSIGLYSNEDIKKNQIQSIQWFVGDEMVEANSETFNYVGKLEDNGKHINVKINAIDECNNLYSKESINSYYSPLIVHDINNPKMDFLYPKFFCNENTYFSLPVSNSVDYQNYKWFKNGQAVTYPGNLTKTDNVQLKYSPGIGCPADFLVESNIAYYNPACDKQGEMLENSIPLKSGDVISDNATEFRKGRDGINSNCTTSQANDNVVDVFYKLDWYDLYYNGLTFDLQLSNSEYLTSVEFVDSLGNSIAGTCLDNISTDNNLRTYKLEPASLVYYPGLYSGILRLEIGSTAPIGYARTQGVNGVFSLKVTSGITAVDDATINAQKQIAHTYNMLGAEVDANFKGLVIRKFTDGTTQKVFND